MLLQHILVLDDVLLDSQKLEHVQVAEKRAAQGKRNDARKSHDVKQGDDEAEDEAKDLLCIEEDVKDLLLGELAACGECFLEETVTFDHFWLVF